MNETLIWLGVIIVTAAIEAATAGLVTIWFSIGGVFGMIASLCGLDTTWQIIIFLAASAITLLFTRPLVKDKLKMKKTKTNADMAVGQEGVVIEQIDPVMGTGQVKLGGQVWSAKSDSKIEAGELVRIREIKGVHLFVEKIEQKMKEEV